MFDDVYIGYRKYMEVIPFPNFRTGPGNVHYLDPLIVSGNKDRSHMCTIYNVCGTRGTHCTVSIGITTSVIVAANSRMK